MAPDALSPPPGNPPPDPTGELRLPAAFPEPRPARVEVEETHASRVFLGESDVYKTKKPVDLGFLDFRTLEARKAACEAEISLNRRLAPDVYLGVVPVVRRADGRLTFGGDGAVVDYAVHMRRMPDERRCDHLLAQGALDGATVDAIADRLAAFHAGAQCDARTSAYGEPSVIAGNVSENFEQTRAVIARYLAATESREIEGAERAFLETHDSLFAARIAARRVRDGHGDLRLEHVYLGDGSNPAITVLDCIEFNERFRYADVCSDVAFFSMDLEWHGRVDLAERFLARYARASDDYDLYALVDFYEGYRAYVRGKIATFAVDRAPDIAREEAARAARRYFLLALSGNRSSLLAPRLVAVGGIIASGKSTIADAVAAALSAPVIDADRTRKHMLGIAPTTRVPDGAWQGAYDPNFTEEVYAEVLRRAEVVLASGRPVVVDASFRSVSMRRAVRALAVARGVPFSFVECRVDREVARARLVSREREAGVSDGRREIFDAFCARFEPVVEIAPPEHVLLDTTRPLLESLADIEARVATWPPALVT